MNEGHSKLNSMVAQPLKKAMDKKEGDGSKLDIIITEIKQGVYGGFYVLLRQTE